MAKIKSEIHTDKRNYRKHSDKNKRIINKSLSELGAGRSILIDSEDEIIAGNGVFEPAQKNNIPIKIVETDGSELIAVKRTDLKTKDKKRQKLALIDNHASDTSEFDFPLILEDFDPSELKDFSFEIQDFSEEKTKEEKEIKYFKKTHILISFSPEKILELKPFLDKILELEGIEYEQSSN